MKSSLLITALAGITLAGSAAAAPIVLTTSDDATYFQVTPVTDERVNVDVNRVGGNNTGTIEFVALIGFDLDASGLSVADLQDSTFELAFTLGSQDNTPALDDIAIDYIGTFAAADFGANGAGGASANAIALGSAASVESIFSGNAGGTGAKTYNADAISSDSFSEQYAFFRISDPSVAAHQWDIPADAATLTIVPEPSSLALLGLGGLAMLRRRRA